MQLKTMLAANKMLQDLPLFKVIMSCRDLNAKKSHHYLVLQGLATTPLVVHNRFLLYQANSKCIDKEFRRLKLSTKTQKKVILSFQYQVENNVLHLFKSHKSNSIRRKKPSKTPDSSTIFACF